MQFSGDFLVGRLFFFQESFQFCLREVFWRYCYLLPGSFSITSRNSTECQRLKRIFFWLKEETLYVSSAGRQQVL